MPTLRVLTLAVLTALGVAAPARAAGEPTMPLGEVRQGMQCTVRSVLQGTTISTFDATVVDVVQGDAASQAPRILVRFSGSNIERTGVGPGFSGSPISCDGRVIGAISESVGEYGGLLALATPIEAILGQPVEPPVGAARAPRDARSLAGPISIAGLSPAVGDLFARAARRGGRLLYAPPGRPLAASFPYQRLVPGASMAAGLSSGDVTAGAIGTVTYVDGDDVWAFGHPLDGTGRRSLFLQDAYVYTIVNNPIGTEGAGTYKLAAPGHDVGVLSGDGFDAVAGRLNVLPARFPLKVVARDQDTGHQQVVSAQIADETALGLPTGVSSLAFVGSAAVGQAAAVVLGAVPSRQTGEMCVRIQLAERKAPLRFCNRYVVRGSADTADSPLGVGTPMVSDFAEAVTDVDEYNFATLHITGVEVNLKVQRGLKQAFLLGATGPHVVRRGHDVQVRVRAQEVRGPASTRTISVHVPKSVPRGERNLKLEGTPSDAAAGLDIDLGALLFGADGASSGVEDAGNDEAGPRTVAALADQVAGIARYDGLQVSFPSSASAGASLDELGESPSGPEARARRKHRVLRDPDLRLSGSVRIPVTVK